MRRTLIRLEDVADLGNLSHAFWLAARGLRHRADVVAFAADLDANLARLAKQILGGNEVHDDFHRFTVHDPKLRVIHAPSLTMRVLHHALMRQLDPRLEASLVADTFACRVGKGSLAAVRRAQQHLRRFPWHVKVDVRRYFDSIDHAVLLEVLRRRFKGEAVLHLCGRIIAGYQTAPGKGLPIGALTSQHFANAYLGEFDRYLQQDLRVAGMVRYMDDVVWWCDSRVAARTSLAQARQFLAERLQLQLKSSAQVHASVQGLTVCGFRIRRGALLLSRRRRQRYALARRKWELAWRAGQIDAGELQRGVNAALAITAHAQALIWRQEQLRRVPPVDA